MGKEKTDSSNMQGRIMRKVALALLLALSILSTGCGSTSTTTVSSGGSPWEGSLLESSGAPTPYNFITLFSIAGDGSLSITSLTFITNNPCFVSGASASGQSALTVDTTTDEVSGTLDYAVQSGDPAGNALQLTGTSVTGTEPTGGSLTGGVVTGNWTLTGSSGCTGGGTFTLRQQ
jgi:hypothetical protein